MPQDTTPRVIEPVNLDEEPYQFDDKQIPEKYALQLVTETFSDYENFRSMNHDPRWNVADGLYWGWLPQKTWEGTTIPRSCLPMQIVFDQVEAAMPAITQELFSPQEEWFQVETEDIGGDVHEARDVQEHLSYVLEHSKNDYGLSARNEIELSIKDILLYGNGGISLEWDSILNRPVVQKVDIRDFYIDPGCSIPSVDECRSIIRRKFLTVEELTRLRDDPRMSIPEDAVLYHMSKNTQFAMADQTKRNQEALRGVNFVPNTTDYMALPSQRKIEVLLYYTNKKIIWVLNREWVAYNEDNPYDFIPFCFAPCYTVPGRFYAQSIADVQESNQRYIESLLNGRLDAVHMQLMPPRIYKQGQLMTPAQLRWYPGATYKSDDPKNMALLQPQTETANVYSEIQYIQDASEKRTGVNSMTSGIPRPSNTNRTATGVQAVSSGSMSRLRAIVANLENYLIVPLLYKLYALVQKHNLPDHQVAGLSALGRPTQVKSNSFHKDMRFRMLASSKMMTREKLASVFPFLMQYMVNGTFMGELQKSGKTVDFDELFQMLRDATGTGRLYNFVREMNPQEKQASQAPPPEVQAKMQQSQADLQSREKLQGMKSQTDVQVAQINNSPNPQEAEMQQAKAEAERKKGEQELVQMQAQTQQEAQSAQMEQERDKARIHSEQVLAQIKAQSEMDKHKVAMVGKQMEMQGKQQEQQMNMQGMQQEHTLNMQQMKQTGEDQRSQEFANHVLGLKQQDETHKQTMKQQDAAGAADLKRSKSKAAQKKKERAPNDKS